jgi:glycosyltransferase involved in cell wall biosynthesis
MRILYLITRADLGGAQVHLLDLLKGLRSSIDATVAVGEEGFFTDAVRDIGLECRVAPHLVQPISPVRDMRALFQLVQLMRELKPDLIHAHTSKAGVIGRFAARIAGIPSVFTAHTWCFAEGTSWKWKLAGVPCERLAARFGSAIINVSDANRRLAVSNGISNRVRLLTIHNGITDVSARAEPKFAGIPTIVMVARCAPQKNQALLLRALAEIDIPAQAIFVGDGETRPALEAEVCRLNLTRRVEFLGERRDVAQILAECHIFALPTRWEGFPLSILEAMRAGLPVVASNVGGVAEAVIDSKTGFLAQCGDEFAFRARLRELIERPTLRGQMGAAGRKRYETEFTLESMLHKTLAVYQEVLDRRPRANTVAVSTAHFPEVPVDF